MNTVLMREYDSGMDIDKAVAFANLKSTTFVKGEKDIASKTNLHLNNCKKSHLYFLTVLRSVTIKGCTDSTIVLGAASQAVRIEDCERVKVITACRSIHVRDCKHTTLYIAVASTPEATGENAHIQIAPYNTHYSGLCGHLQLAGLPEGGSSKWWRSGDLPSSECTGVSMMPAADFSSFAIPFITAGGRESEGNTMNNPFHLPIEYSEALRRKMLRVEQLRHSLATIEDRKRRKTMQEAVEAKFREWLHQSGNMGQVQQLLKLTVTADKENLQPY